ncbi:MAG: hypothetical protein ABR547_08975 [Halanaerobium sp.]
MKRKVMFILVLSLFFIAFGLNSVGAENKVVSESIKVRVTIPIMQKMEVVKAVDIHNLGSLFNDQEAGDSVIIEDAGAIRVDSNANWRLEVNNIVPVSNYDILFRIEGDNRWQNLSKSSGFVNGEYGSHLFNFDIKIVSRNGSVTENLNQKVEFGYTLAGYLH